MFEKYYAKQESKGQTFKLWE